MKTKRRKLLINLMMVFAMFVTVLPVSVLAAAPSDIENHWAKEAISDWVAKGLINGYTDGSFKPDRNITRAEFMALVNRAFQFTETAQIRYKDVKSGDWYYETVAQAEAAGYITGYNDNTMRPNNAITRAEAAAIMARVKNLTANEEALGQFSDAAKIPAWVKSLVGAVVKEGYMEGYPDKTFKAQNFITRAETVVTLNRVAFAGTVYDKAGTYGPTEGSATLKGSVVIKAADVTLQNTVVEGNLTIDKAVGDGSVTLKNVTVKGSTYVNGGGANSIHVVNSNLSGIVVLKDNGTVRIVAEGKTVVGELVAGSSVVVEEKDLTGEGFGKIIVEKKTDGTLSISLVGVKADSIEIQSEGVTVSADANTTINTLMVNADGVKVETAEGTAIGTLVANGKVEVTGEGTIEKAEVNAEGVSFETKPGTVETAPGITPPTIGAGNPGTPGGGSGGGNDGGNGDEPSNSTINPESVTFDIYDPQDITVTMTLNGNQLVKITNGDKALVKDTDYLLTENKVTIKKEFLSQQEVGTLELTFDFNAGNDPKLTIEIKDTQPEKSTYRLTLTGETTFNPGPLVEAGEDVAAAVANVAPVSVTLSTYEVGKAGYSNVRFIVEGADDHVQLWAKDTAGNWVDIKQDGWGPEAGFSIPAEYNVTTDVYFLSDKVGDRSFKIKLVDVQNSDSVIAEEGFTATVASPFTVWNLDQLTVAGSVYTSGMDQTAINDAVYNAIDGLTPIVVALIGDKLNYKGNVRIAPVNESGIQLWAKDTAENWYDINQSGWGPEEGFLLQSAYRVSTDIYLLTSVPGTHTIQIQLVTPDGTPVAIEEFTADVSESPLSFTNVPLFYVSDLVNASTVENAVYDAVYSGDLTPIKVTLDGSKLGYDGNVRIQPMGAGNHVQLWAKDTAGNWYDINQVGWGPETGFTANGSYSVTTDVYFFSDNAGVYNLTLKLVAIDGEKAGETLVVYTLPATVVTKD